MAIACLAKISPLDPGTGNRVDLFVSAANNAAVTGLNGVVWEPALVTAPSLGINLWQGDFTAPVNTGGATLALNMRTVKQTYAGSDAYLWAGAPVEIYAEEIGTAWPWTAKFKGVVRGYGRKVNILTLNAELDVAPFDKNILTAIYAGTGGAEGGADIKNQLKPLVIGWAMNVQPKLINTTDYVYQFSAYGAIEEVTKLYERGSDFGASTGDYASYALLVAASIPEGRWASCLAEGMVRLGAPQFGVITGDIKGCKFGGGTAPRLTGALLTALATQAGVSGALIESSTLTALDTTRAYPINKVLTEQVTWLDLARELVMHCNWQSGITLTGKFFTYPVTLTGSEVITFNTAGTSLPLVIESEEQDVSLPYFKTEMGANRCWRVHTLDEIASDLTLIDRGLYDAATFYREGNIVTLADGSRWLYINAVPTSGNAPPAWPATSNAWWDNMSPPIATGKTIEIAQTTQIITYDGEDVLEPTTQTNTFTITRTNTVGTCNWTLADTLGNTLTPATYLSATSGDTVTMTAANFSAAIAVNGAQGLAVTATVVDGGSITDVVSVFKLRAGSNALVGFLTNESVSLAASSAGVVSSFATATGTFKVFYGTVDVTTSATFAETTETNCTGTVAAGTGVYSVSALSANTGEYIMTATYLGTPIVKTFSLAKSIAGTNGTNGSNGSNGAAGANGTRTATLYMYKWLSTTPATFPSGSSTYTWSTGQFTNPGTLNGWSRTIGTPSGGDKLWRVTQIFTDTDTSTTDSVTWSASTSEQYTPTLGDLAALNTVATAKIDANAVTLLTAAFTGGTVSCNSSTYVNVQTVTFTATGNPVLITIAESTYVATNGTLTTFRLKRNGTVIWTAAQPQYTGPSPEMKSFAGVFVDTPASGSTTYDLEFANFISGDTTYAYDRAIAVLLTKR